MTAPETGNTAAAPVPPAPESWSWPGRLVFRFVFVLILCVFLPFPAGSVPGTEWLAGLYESFSQSLVAVTGSLLGFAEPVQVISPMSGDGTYNWVLLAGHVGLSLVLALLWSLIDRRREVNRWWSEGLRIYTRYALAMVMLNYGLSKVFPRQFPPLTYDQLIEPLGQFSPMGHLWAFMSGSQAYSFLSGLLEIVGALLLIFRRTTLAGALVLSGVMANVVALNFFYDVPVKIFSTQLLLTCLFLIWPDAKRLGNVLLLNRGTEPIDQQMPVSRRVRLSTWALKFAFLAWTFGTIDVEALRSNAPKVMPPLFGLYEVETFVQAGQEVPPLLSEKQRWRRVVFNERKRMVVQKVDDSVLRWTAAVDPEKKTIALNGARWADATTYQLSYEETGGVLVLRGSYEGQEVEARLRRVENPQFPLTLRGFHWVNEYPFNR